MHLWDLQKYVREVGIEVWGVENVTNTHERKLRFAEEALELLRASGLSFSTVLQLLQHEYHDRQVGEVGQEIAGTFNTLLGLASSLNLDVEELALNELGRVLANKEKCRTKHDAKPVFAKAV